MLSYIRGLKHYSFNELLRRLGKEEIKQQLIDSIINSDIIETKELDEKADKVENFEDTVATIIKQYKEIIRTKKNNIYVSRIIKEKVFEDLKRRKILSN